MLSVRIYPAIVGAFAVLPATSPHITGPLKLVPKQEPEGTSPSKISKMPNVPRHFTVFEKSKKRNVIVRTQDPDRAAAFAASNEKRETALARRKAERCSPHNRVNVRVGQILQDKNKACSCEE